MARYRPGCRRADASQYDPVFSRDGFYGFALVAIALGFQAQDVELFALVRAGIAWTGCGSSLSCFVLTLLADFRPGFFRKVTNVEDIVFLRLGHAASEHQKKKAEIKACEAIEWSSNHGR